MVTKFLASLKQFIIKKINKSVLNTITFFIEDDNNEKLNFNGETLTFKLQMIKVQSNMFTYNYVSNCFCLYVHLYEYLCMIYTSDNKSVNKQLFEYLYLFIHTFIWVFILICVINELSKV